MSINNVGAVSDAIKYMNGLPLEEQKSSITGDIKATVCSPINAIFGGMQVKDSLMDTFEVSKLKELKPALQNLGEVQMGETIGTSNALRSTKIKDQLGAAVDKFIKKADMKKAAKAGKELATTSTELARTTTELANVADDAAGAAVKSGKGIFSKIGSFFSSAKNVIKSGAGKVVSAIAKTGPGKAIAKVGSAIMKSPVGGILSKGGKLLKGTGAVGMMVFDGIASLITEVIPAFQQGGAKAGFKQIGKSALKVAGTGVGWAAGTTAATAIGAAIGSIFPGVGTVIGGAIGQFIGGFIGSAIGSGVAKKITGKSEAEKLQEQQVNDAAQQIANDPNALNQLNQELVQKVQSDIENGTVTEDTEKIAEYLNSGAFNTTGTNDWQNPSNPYTTNPNGTTNGMTYWAEMAQRAAQGDTSIYNISDDRLASVFNQPVNTESSTSQQKQEEPINYF